MANNQYNFLDYAGLSLFWNNVKSIIEENELATASALTNLDTRVDNVESSKADKVHAHTSVLDVNGSSATTFAYSKAGMNYGDYSWLAGWNGYELRAVDKTQFARASHEHTFNSLTSKPTTISGYGITDALTTSNYTSYTVKKDGTGASGTWGINISGNAGTSNRTKFLETFQQNSTTNTYGAQYPIWAQWSDSTNVRLKCTDYTVWTDKATYATTAGSAPASDVYSWAKQSTKPPYTGTEVTLSGYSKNSSYTPIASGDSVQAAIAKLEGALSGLEDLLASI